MIRHPSTPKLLAVCLFASLYAFPAKAETTDGTRPAQPAAAPVTARDAGIRYGQAGGAASVCENTVTTAKAEALASGYSGSELEDFKIQAETVLMSWKKTLTCEKTGDPNQCRLIHQMSCLDAMREIGPGGAVLPGLIEIRKP